MLSILQHKLLFKWISIAWALLIITLSSIPHLRQPKLHLPIRLDYIEHFGIYFILGIFVVLWRINTKGLFVTTHNRAIIMAAYLFATIDETHQLWVPGRTFSWQDIGCNLLGLSAAFCATPYIYRALSHNNIKAKM